VRNERLGTFKDKEIKMSAKNGKNVVYDIVCVERRMASLPSLIEEVNKRCQDGWVPCGSPIVDSAGFYLQAIVRIPSQEDVDPDKSR